MEAIYKVVYDHPNGDHYESPSTSLIEMDDECMVPPEGSINSAF